MFGRKKPKKEHGLYYLLPGMNTGNRRRRRMIARISIAIGLVCSVIFGLVLWYMNRY
jgi:hypothetical protein